MSVNQQETQSKCNRIIRNKYQIRPKPFAKQGDLHGSCHSIHCTYTAPRTVCSMHAVVLNVNAILCCAVLYWWSPIYDLYSVYTYRSSRCREVYVCRAYTATKIPCVSMVYLNSLKYQTYIVA